MDLDVGEPIAILAKNSIEYLLLYYAASTAGVVPVPLNYRSAAPEWLQAIDDSGAVLVKQLLASAFAPPVAAVAPTAARLFADCLASAEPAEANTDWRSRVTRRKQEAG